MNPFTIQNPVLQEQWETMEEAERTQALNQMWRNFCVNDTYEPGSTFKIITAAAALSENVVRLDETFQCSGSLVVADRRIRCHKAGGHGTETFVQGVQNSCNPVFMTLALRLGADRFYEYLKAFRFDQKTGIDISGEAVGIMYNVGDVGPVELATMGFGQSIAITPMQLLRAAASAVNGGNLITPHFGTKIQDSEGVTLKTLEFPVEKESLDTGGFTDAPRGSGDGSQRRRRKQSGHHGIQNRGQDGDQPEASQKRQKIYFIFFMLYSGGKRADHDVDAD